MCCCCVTANDETRGQKFQTSLTMAPCADCPWSCFWCLCELNPFCMGWTQHRLRRLVLEHDWRKYECFQGYYRICCCCQAGSFHEKGCPSFCAWAEGCCCNFTAIGASRAYVQEQYNITHTGCDYPVIKYKDDDACFLVFHFLNNLMDCMFNTCCVSCMTAQVAYELKYRHSLREQQGDQIGLNQGSTGGGAGAAAATGGAVGDEDYDSDYGEEEEDEYEDEDEDEDEAGRAVELRNVQLQGM